MELRRPTRVADGAIAKFVLLSSKKLKIVLRSMKGSFGPNNSKVGLRHVLHTVSTSASRAWKSTCTAKHHSNITVALLSIIQHNTSHMPLQSLRRQKPSVHSMRCSASVLCILTTASWLSEPAPAALQWSRFQLINILENEMSLLDVHLFHGFRYGN